MIVSEALTFKKITKKFGDKTVLYDIDLEIPKGKFTALVGPSGCGKTTLLRIAAGLEQASSGQVLCGDRVFSDVEKKFTLPPEKRNLGMLFQSYAIWPHMDVASNVAFPLKMRKLGRVDCDKRVAEMLDKVGLGGFGPRLPQTLSGGQQQRVALARALVQEPGILLLDEPLSNLDASLRNQMRAEIRTLQQSLKLTAVVVTHDWADARMMCDHVVLLKDGHIEQSGSVKEIETNPTSDFVKQLVNH